MFVNYIAGLQVLSKILIMRRMFVLKLTSYVLYLQFHHLNIWNKSILYSWLITCYLNRKITTCCIVAVVICSAGNSCMSNVKYRPGWGRTLHSDNAMWRLQVIVSRHVVCAPGNRIVIISKQSNIGFGRGTMNTGWLMIWKVEKVENR